MENKKRVRELVLIALISALNIGSRVALQFLPNIKPVTSIIIMCTLVFGCRFGCMVSIVTVLVSGLFLGFGTYIPFQILAWVIIVFLSWFLQKCKADLNVYLMALYCGICGYIYGFFVSLDKFFIAGPYGFLTYYLAGLSFDTLHCIGNVVFWIICYPVLMPIFIKEKKKLDLLEV